jgi:pyridoxal biosynthesis lyase PdxS
MSLAAILKKARIAEEAGACAVMALERVPADIRASGGVARMASARFSSQSIMVLDPLPLWFRVIPT